MITSGQNSLHWTCYSYSLCIHWYWSPSLGGQVHLENCLRPPKFVQSWHFQMALHNHSWQTMDVLRLFTTNLWREHRDVDKTGFLYQSIGDPLMTVLPMRWIPVILSTRTVRDKEMILPVHRRQRRRVRCVRLGGRPGRGETGPGSPTCGPRTPSVHAGRRTGTRRACSSANAKQLQSSCWRRYFIQTADTESTLCFGCGGDSSKYIRW